MTRPQGTIEEKCPKIDSFGLARELYYRGLAPGPCPGDNGLYELAERQTGSGSLVELGRANYAHLVEVEKAYKAGGRMLGLAAGLVDLDNLVGGLRGGDLTVCGHGRRWRASLRGTPSAGG